MPKRTPLYSSHQKLGGRLVEFGGWEMPVQYTNITDEHLCVRRRAGLFDIAHMGEFLISGSGAQRFLNGILTNDLRRLSVGLGQYTLLCNERGGVVDDLYAYRLAESEYLLIVNASRIEDDFAWLDSRLGEFADAGSVELRNCSNELAAIALQGPTSASVLQKFSHSKAVAGAAVASAGDLAKNEIARFATGAGELWISRTGYTGEDGFELIVAADKAASVWGELLALGRDEGLQPCGLGARDTLRTEVCYPLYGHELNLETTPIEAGVGFFVSLDKGDFVGREVLSAQKIEGPPKRLVAFKMTTKSPPPRERYVVRDGVEASADVIGEVTSGTQSPSLSAGVGLAYVRPDLAKAGAIIGIEIRGRLFPAEIVKKPIYQKPVEHNP